MEDAGDKTSHDLQDVNHAIRDLPEGWVTREMVQKTHAAIENCLQKLHTLMQEPCQETQADLEEGDHNHDTEGPMDDVTDAQKLGDDADNKNNEDDGKPCDDKDDQTYVDDIMRQAIDIDNVMDKLRVMEKVLDGKLPWPTTIQLEVKDNAELTPAFEQCLQVGRSMYGMLECWKSALNSMPDSDQTDKKDDMETHGTVPSRTTTCKGRKSRSKGRKSTMKSRGRKSKVGPKKLKRAKRMAKAKRAEAATPAPAPAPAPAPTPAGSSSKKPKAKTPKTPTSKTPKTTKTPKTRAVAAKKAKKTEKPKDENLENGGALPGSRLSHTDLQKKLHSVPSLQVAPNLTKPQQTSTNLNIPSTQQTESNDSANLD